jgi:AcrR family transcriptional regulator
MTEPNAPAAGPSRRRYGGVSAEARQGQRRERLLEAALDVFGTEGYARATMRLICAKARLTERYFYEHFASLDDAFMALHQQLSEALMAQVAQAYADHLADTPDVRVRASLRAFLQFIHSDPRRARILLMDAVFTGCTDVLDKTTSVQRLLGLMSQRIEMNHPGALARIDIDMVAGGMLGILIHTTTIWAAKGFAMPMESVLDHQMYAWRGLQGWLGELGSAAQTEAQAQTLTTTPPPASA